MDGVGELVRAFWALFSSHLVTVIKGTELERSLISSRDCVRRSCRFSSLIFTRLSAFLWSTNRGIARPVQVG